MRKIILLAAFALLAAGGCQTPVTLQFDGSHYYIVRAGQRFAFDGKSWYQLVQAEVPVSPFEVQPEQWIQVGGSLNTVYQRVEGTQLNETVRPMFEAYTK